MSTYLTKLTFLLFFFIFSHPVGMFAGHAGADSAKRVDFYLKLRDGVLLDCSKYYPSSNARMPSGGWPVIVFCHGYGDDKETELEFAEARARLGFYTFTYSMRGQGKSGGLSNLITRTEMDDLFEVVRYIKNDSLKQDSSRIGIFGGSQGGMIPFMAACHGLQVRTIMADLATAQFASNWIENGSIKTTLFYAMDYDTKTVRYGDKAKNIRRYILSSEPDKWDSLYAEMPKNRDFIDEVSECRIPMLFTNAWQDEFFNTSGCFDIIGKLKSPFSMYFGAVDGHGSDWTEKENLRLGNRQSYWIDYWLCSQKYNVLDSVQYTFASSRFPIVNNKWSYVPFSSKQWPCAGLEGIRFNLGMDLKLLNSEKPGKKGVLQFENKVKAPIGMKDFVATEFEGAKFNAAFEKTSVCFESAPLDQNYQLIGQAKAHLVYSSDAKLCQYNFQIWEVAADGTEFFVTRINYTDRHYQSNSKKTVEVSGQANSHIFNKGSKIKLVLTNLDTQYTTGFPMNCPFVLPVLEKSINKVYVGKGQNSYLELPMRPIP